MTHAHHPHHHDHSHGTGHDHVHGANEQRIGLAALLTGAFMLAEIAGGLISGSLALLADAGHMLTDFASLGLAWYGFRLSRRPADWKRTYGYDRFSILAAFTNGLALFAIAAWIVIEAVERLRSPGAITADIMMWVAATGLAVNVLSYWILSGGDHDNLNVRAAALHVVGDLLGSIAALTAAVVIMTTGWTPIDPLLSVLVAVIILKSAWAVVTESGHILLEGTPPGIDNRAIASDLEQMVEGVIDVHHVHAWSISQERPMITLHARVSPNETPEHATSAIKRRLREKFNIGHATVEIEHDNCADTRATERSAVHRHS
jgi:cobalt-zinc-cadmium efflux system protein